MQVDVAIPNTPFDFLTYQTTENLQPGDLVLVPLREKFKYGIVVKANSQRDLQAIKDVRKTVARGFVSGQLIKLYTWLADYYLCPLGMVLKFAFPGRIIKKYEPPAKMPETPMLIKEPTPTYGQNYAISKILSALKKKIFSTFLLYGITSSGKTEVYLRVIAELIKNQGRALVLVPEISMTPLLLNRFKQRFGNEVATIHSALTGKERRQIWFAIKNGTFKVVIGPRSAIFLPIPDLKIIIVDEEHDHSYKEHQHALKYNARDLAVMRGKIENIVVVLGSATPQIESYYNAGIGKYHLLILKERIEKRPLPEIEVIDLKKDRKKFISPELARRIEEILTKDEQAILFLNRRGFAPNLICPDCGYLAQCPFCKLPMVYHRQFEDREPSHLSCHICNYRADSFSICPKCGSSALLYRGAGTQRIEELVNKMVKGLGVNVKDQETPLILRLDRDVTKKRGAAERILTAFEQGKAKILLGTQLVTKGFDFPKVTLVGIVNADVILNLPDFRGAERTFQILTQVAGRSGRGEKPGKVLIQTFHPEQYAIIFSQLQDYPKFYAQEMKLRKELNLPPYSKLILLRLTGKSEEQVWSEANRVYGMIRKITGLKAFGPNRSFYYKIRKNYRVYILLKVGLHFPHRKLNFLKQLKISGARLEIDVDPLDVF